MATVHPAARAATYRFAPSATAAGPTPQTVLSVTDLTTSPGSLLTTQLDVEAPGAVYLNAYASSASFPLSTVRACLRQLSGPACAPTSVPNPGYWSVSAADLAHTHNYVLEVTVSQAT